MAKKVRTIYVDETVWDEAMRNAGNEKPANSLSRRIEALLIKYNQAVKEKEKEK